jgi:hypothetical protein
MNNPKKEIQDAISLLLAEKKNLISCFKNRYLDYFIETNKEIITIIHL